jgi:anaerobic magnesium-protoporphyrin IX monomethyl ester cyclase
MKCLLIVYDNDSFLNHFPLGTAYIASVLRKEGHNVTIYNQDIHHYSEEHLTNYIEKNNFELIGIGLVAGYYPYKKLLSISEAINKTKNRNDFAYIIGGHMVSVEPQYFLEKTKADCVVIGESEETIKEMVNRNIPANEVKGICLYDLEENFIVPSPRPLIKDLDSIPFPAYDLFPIDVYRLRRMPHATNKDFVMSILSGRGCPFQCTFCYRLMPGVRLRSIGSIVEEIQLLKTNYGITYIDFEDDLTMTSEIRMNELCEAFLKNNLNIKWYCEGRLNFVNEKILNIMKRAGCVFINYGIEALDDKVLETMKKNLTVEQIIRGVEVTRKVGISQGLNIMWGNIGDTKETLNKAVDFLINYDDCSQIRTIRPVTPYPGTELYNTTIKKGLIKDIEDFYENKHLNSDLLTINFTDLTEEEIYDSLLDANLRLLNNYYKNKEINIIMELKNLYKGKNDSFRGFRQT